MIEIALGIAQVALLVAIAPLLAGVLRKTKARFQARRGPGLLQPYRDLRKWWARATVQSDAAGPVQRLAPAVVLGAVLVAAGFVPAVIARPVLGTWGDLLVLAGFLALSRFAMALAALDAGSAFGGMGSSREVAIAALIEPALVLALVAVAVPAGSTDLGTIAARGASGGLATLTLGHVLAAAAFGLIVVAETGHLPVDNPDTHLELTMVHEGMLLETSGRGLALLSLAAHLRQAVIVAVFAAAFVPWGIASDLAPASIAIGVVALALKLVVGTVGLGLADAVAPKLRILRLPDFLGVAVALALLASATQLWLPR